MASNEVLSEAYTAYLQAFASYLNIPFNIFMILFLIFTLWALIWKGLALWKSARKKQLIWFVALLIVNTVGLLEILYIFIFSKISLKKPKKKSSKVKKRKKK